MDPAQDHRRAGELRQELPGLVQHTIDTTTTLFFTGAYVTYQLGTTATSTIANGVATSFTAATKAVWDTTTYSTTNSYTKYLVLQLAVGATAGPGNWTQQTVNYSYDEA